MILISLGIVVAAAEKQHKKTSMRHDVTRNIARLGASHMKILLAAHDVMRNKTKRGGPAAKGIKRISASQPPEVDSDLALLLSGMLETYCTHSRAPDGDADLALLLFEMLETIKAKVLVSPSHCALSYSCLILNAS